MPLTGIMDIPQWYLQYQVFTETLLQRNAWFIKLRFAAALVLCSTVLFLHFFGQAFNGSAEFYSAFIPVLLILGFNLLFSRLLKKHKAVWNYSELLHFALAQVIADLLTLAMIVYVTGGIESFFSLLFIFHVIISALLFSSRIVVIISGSVILFYNVFAWLEFGNIVPHFTVGSIIPQVQYSSMAYLLLNTFLFSGTVGISALISFRIASDMVQQQKALFEAFTKLEEAEREKQQYVIAVVHEIKQPVTAVTSFLELITQNILGEVPDEINTVVKKCIVRSREAVEMINSILKISRLRLMNQIEHGEVDLPALLEEVINRYQPLIEKKELKAEIAPLHNPVLLKGDQFLLTLAISNVISNAIKYNSQSGVIRIEVQETQNTVSIIITDSGIGISSDELSKVTKDFFRASNLQGKNIEGAGVGLSVVKQIIEKHNGTLRFLSPSGIGNEEYPGTKAILQFNK